MTIKVIIAGATGWAGSALARSIEAEPDLELVAAVSRTHAGKRLSEVLTGSRLGAPVHATAAEALGTPCDVFFDYTKPDVARSNALAALDAGAHAVVGTSGLSDADYDLIAAAAIAAGRGVLAVGNFAITAVLLQKFAEIAARYVPSWEIIDYAHAGKRDAPSGTAREIAHRLSKVRTPHVEVAVAETAGPPESRGAEIAGSRVHSIRVPSFVISAEVIFGMPDQRLALRHDSGSSAAPYVDGALLAIRRVQSFVGLRRGLDQIMDF
jgi:4-hydroxy-tetrahydrodipicolinate reductase